MEAVVKDDTTLLLEKRIKHLENELKLTRREKDEATQKYFEFYAQMDNLVKERTAELQQTQNALEEKNRSLEDALKLVQNANAIRSGFLANISHELRTPLNAILGFSQIIYEEEKKENNGPASYIKQIIHSAHKLTDLINDLISLSKLEAGQLVLEKKEVSLGEILNTCREDLFKKIKEKNIDFKKVVPDEDPVLLIDDYHVRRIIFHLVDNALKHTTDGEIIFESKILSLSKEKATLSLSIKDSGTGIPEGHLEKIKNYLSNPPSSSDVSYEGLGIGLVLCRLIADEMDGTLEIDSAVGEGTEVRLHLRNIKVVRLNASAEKTNKDTDVPEKVCRKFLVVDDTVENSILIQRFYETKGYTVWGAPSVEKGLELAKKNKPELILMDINMPGKDGYEGLRLFKSDKALAHIPIIAFSASNDNRDIEKARRAGFDEYLLKPVDFNTLDDLLHQYGGHHSEDIIPAVTKSKSSIDFSGYPLLADLVERYEQHINGPVLSEIKDTLIKVGEIVFAYKSEELAHWFEKMSKALIQFDMSYLKTQFQVLTDTYTKREK